VIISGNIARVMAFELGDALVASAAC